MWMSHTAICWLVGILSVIYAEDPDDMDPDNKDQSELWKPANGVPREEWLRCMGMPCKKFEKIQLQKLKYLAKFNDPDDLENKDTDYHQPELMSKIEIQNIQIGDDDILSFHRDEFYTRNASIPQRKKRKIYKRAPKWTFPIVWKFDGTHTRPQQHSIKEAIRLVEQNTCARFREIGVKDQYFQAHLLMVTHRKMCAAYMGRVSGHAIPVFLGLSFCFSYDSGPLIHELFHVLGFAHEHSRSDRDSYITINQNNIHSKYKHNFNKLDTRNHLVPYDFNSIMHYGRYACGIKGPVLSPAKGFSPYFANNMGRLQLSFLDKKAMNLYYQCGKKCPGGSLRQPCQKGGFQNPNRCSSCVCPTGFTGRYCETFLPGVGAICGKNFGILHREVSISSPSLPKTTKHRIECNWYFSVPPGTNIAYQFTGQFNIHKRMSTCFSWVEAIDEIGMPGPRFCGGVIPSEKFRINGTLLIINFKGASTCNQCNGRPKPLKFQIKVKPVRGINIPTMRTTTTATTKSYVTTTRHVGKPPPKGKIFFSCSFEKGNHSPEACGITQSKDDTFDWSIRKKKASFMARSSGPIGTYYGYYYAYIEPGYNKRLNAKLEFPVNGVDWGSKYCVMLMYSMYGHGMKMMTIKRQKQNGETITVTTVQQSMNSKQWKFLNAATYMDQGDKIIIEGYKHIGFLAIDKIRLKRC